MKPQAHLCQLSDSAQMGEIRLIKPRDARNPTNQPPGTRALLTNSHQPEVVMVERNEQGDTLQREFRDVFELFKYFIEVDREIYLANEVDICSGGPTVVTVQDAWIWDDRRPHRFVSRAEVRTEGPVRIEELAHPQRDVRADGTSVSATDQTAKTVASEEAGAEG